MSKITNDGLMRSSTGCFIAVSIWQQWASKGKDLCIGYDTNTIEEFNVDGTAERNQLNLAHINKNI